jgi:hypothetical protein
MNSHLYLLRTQAKNWFLELKQKPGKLALYLLLLLVILGGAAGSLFGASQTEAALPVRYLLPVLFALLIIFYIVAIQKGLASGDSIFDMSDVNLLFVSPVNPRATLLYGLIRMTGTVFWAGFFILFQGSSLANFGVGPGSVYVLFGIVMILLIVLTLLSLVIYSATNSRPNRKRIVRVAAIAILLPAFVYFAARFTIHGDWVTALDDTIASPLLSATPFVGWASASAVGFMQGNLTAGYGWLGLLVLSGVGMVAYIMLSHSDYYEDVLVATETAFEKKRAKAEGNILAAASGDRLARVSRTGLGGKGAQVFLYKHLRETFRQNRLGFLSMYMVITTSILVLLAIFLSEAMNVIIILQVVMWIQIFMIGTGRGLLETYTHYIYMMPGSAFSKLLWSNMEMMARTLLEAVLFFAIPGLIAGNNPLVILGAMAVYLSFSLMLLGVNYLSMRYLQADLSQGFLIMFYFLFTLILIAPGLAAALAIGFLVGGLGGTLLGLAILTAWNILIALVGFGLARGFLHNVDMPTAKA